MARVDLPSSGHLAVWASDRPRLADPASGESANTCSAVQVTLIFATYQKGPVLAGMLLVHANSFILQLGPAREQAPTSKRQRASTNEQAPASKPQESSAITEQSFRRQLPQ